MAAFCSSDDSIVASDELITTGHEQKLAFEAEGGVVACSSRIESCVVADMVKLMQKEKALTFLLLIAIRDNAWRCPT